MIVGIPKEIKNNENRVGIIPAFAANLVSAKHEVLVEKGAGIGAGFMDEEYVAIGAKIIDSAKEVYKRSDMIVKVKEPLSSEYDLLREGQVLFTYLHLSPDPEQTQALIKSKAVCIAYETVTDNFGRLPLLTPMSIVAGRVSVFMGVNFLQKHHGGSGVLASGVPGVSPAKVIVIGAGVVGTNAIQIAHGIRSDVTVFDNNMAALQRIDDMFHGSVKTAYSNQQYLHDAIRNADIVIGAALVPGANAPKVVTRNMVKAMKPGSIIVDVAIDQGGCAETSKVSTHSHPVYEVDGVLHYCVANIPGAYARTSTIALNNATAPFVMKIANMGYIDALRSDHHLLNGLNVYKGNVTYKAVADAQGLAFVAPSVLL